MKFRTRKPKPPTGMEFTITFCMPERMTLEESRDALLRFCKLMGSATKKMDAVWFKTRITGIPAEFEEALQGAFDSLEKKPQLTLVVDNDRRR